MTHEPPTSSDAHLDLDRLADHEEGLLEPKEAAAADAHLANCPECQQRRADLRSTRALLSALPDEAMPASVAARIDAALAAAGGRRTVVPLTAKRRGWRSHSTAAGLSVAAATAALVAALVVSRTADNSSSDGAGPQAGAGAAAGAQPALALPPPSTSGNRYTPQNVEGTVRQLLAPQTTAMIAPDTTASPGPEADAQTSKVTSIPTSLSRLFSSPGALDACVSGVTAGGSGPPQTPLAIDFARYAGAPAVLIVLPGLEPDRVDAWFVGPDCTSNDPHLLAYKSLPEPSSGSPAP